jgi:uncharacterized membrane protein
MARGAFEACVADENDYHQRMTKTLTFAAVHFCVAFLVAWLLTGSLVVGGAIALVEPLCNTVAYHMHEKAWLRWGRRAPPTPA